MSETVVCKKIKCKDYLADEGDPSWCAWAGCPACVAIKKCPKVLGKQSGKTNEKQSNRSS